jgi:hypothetical protein
MRQSFCGTIDPKRVPDIYVTGSGHCRLKVTDVPVMILSATMR